jgi:hypothetical protein
MRDEVLPERLRAPHVGVLAPAADAGHVDRQVPRRLAEHVRRGAAQEVEVVLVRALDDAPCVVAPQVLPGRQPAPGVKGEAHVRDREDRDAARPDHPERLADGEERVGEVLKHVVHDREVERAVGERAKPAAVQVPHVVDVHEPPPAGSSGNSARACSSVIASKYSTLQPAPRPVGSWSAPTSRPRPARTPNDARLCRRECAMAGQKWRGLRHSLGRRYSGPMMYIR